MSHRHPVNQQFHDERSFGERLADRVVAVFGSWAFLTTQGIILVLWIAYNGWALTRADHFDPYPFILLNLGLSTQAAVATPLILMAGNRASAKDRATLEHTKEEMDDLKGMVQQLLDR